MVQHEIGATEWSPDRELLAQIVEGLDDLSRAFVVMAVGKDPGRTVEVVRPGREPPELPEQAPRAPQRPGQPRTAGPGDWAAVGIPVRVVTPEDEPAPAEV